MVERGIERGRPDAHIIQRVETEKYIRVVPVVDEQLISELRKYGLKGGELESVTLYFQEKAAELYVEGKTSISGAAEMARLTIPEMLEFLVNKGYKSSYSLEDFRRGSTPIEKKLKHK